MSAASRRRKRRARQHAPAAPVAVLDELPHEPPTLPGPVVHVRDAGPLDLPRAADGAAVVLTEGARDALLAHAATTLRDEVGGLLFGEYCADDDGPYTHVRAALPAKTAKGNETRLTLDAAAWADVLCAADEQCPDALVVGWYHTHPGHGVFLSEPDEFIQTSFFGHDGQAAVVVDPTTGARGAFVSRGGAIAPAPLCCEKPPTDWRALAIRAEERRAEREHASAPRTLTLWMTGAALALVTALLTMLVLRAP